MTNQQQGSRQSHGIPNNATRASLAVLVGVGLWGLAVVARPARGAWVWVEAEKPYRATVTRHPFWYDKVKKAELSGGDFLSHWDDSNTGEALYRVNGPTTGEYAFWVRANPVQSRLLYRVNDGPWNEADLGRDATGNINIAEDDKPDLRFLVWARLGTVRLEQGVNYVWFRMDSANHHHGALDCFVFTNEPFTPNGIAKPDTLLAAAASPTATPAREQLKAAAPAERPWVPFVPKADPFRPGSAIDLRSLNERQAGEGGVIAVKEGRFVHANTGEAVRFWAVNGPSVFEPEGLRREARLLAKRGVNLVRVHRAVFDGKTGAYDPEITRQSRAVVDAMKSEGIYTYFSIYFPLWLTPNPNTPWLKGYNGSQRSFAALMFNADFQKHYQEWWKSLLLTPAPTTGKRLIDDPAVAGLEIQNEDSFFFWTFDPKNIPDAQLAPLEARFASWLEERYGNVRQALKLWGSGVGVDRDRPNERRIGFRPLWNIFNQKTRRDQDTARFLAELQRDFYKQTYRYLRILGFKGVITASNWVTASPEILGPIERYTYTVGDFIDRHGYFTCGLKGENAEWSVRDGHTYVNRSALRFDPEEPGKPRVFSHPVADPSFAGKPSMISETTWNRPNRYRSEAPLFYASYGALQGSDAIVHFHLDGSQWSVKPNFFMQPWTLMSPAMMGQFPAAALIFRKGLVAEGDLLADINLPPEDLFALKGTPLPQDGALDELRMKDVPQGTATLKPGNLIDPLIYFAGRTAVRFGESAAASSVKDPRSLIDRAKQTVTSTHGQLRLDYGKGLLVIDAPSAQGASGNLRAGGTIPTKDLNVTSSLDLGHVVAVSLDDRPLASSSRILLQVMTEERATGFQTRRLPDGLEQITSIGRDPWQIRPIEGTVRLTRPDASRLQVTALDVNGDPVRKLANAAAIQLDPATLYYLIEPAKAR